MSVRPDPAGQARKEREMTVKEWIQDLASRNSSSDEDEKMMANLLRRLGFPKAVCTCGIAYLEGKGTIDAPPTSIHSVANMLLKRT
jgi:hypothetical protein